MFYSDFIKGFANRVTIEISKYYAEYSIVATILLTAQINSSKNTKLILWNPYFLCQKLLFFTKSQKNDQFLLKMEPKEPSPTHPNRTDYKQESPTRSRGRPRLTTEQKEEPPKRPRGRPRLTS